MRRDFAVIGALNHHQPSDALSRQPAADDEKRVRLAAALRENLKRRKAQARARQAEEADAEQAAPPAQADSPRS